MSGDGAITGERSAFYARTLTQLLERGVLRPDMAVLVVCGGAIDRDVLHALGFRDVVVSNIDEEADPRAYEPFRWAREDAEALSYDDESFDVVIVSAGLHHCRSPHRALLEMYRVARVAVVALESRDSALMRAAAALGAVSEYELEAVATNRFRTGGVRNSNVPNFVYRWTEREVEKTIAAHAPFARHEVLYFREFELPTSVVALQRSARRRTALRLLGPVVRSLVRLVPSQANLFAFAVLKPQLPRDLQPWMRLGDEGPAPDEEWIRARVLSN